MDIFAQIAIPVICILVGLLVGRAMERSGKLLFRPSAWRYRPVSIDDPSNAEGVDYECRIEIFNGKDKATALNVFRVKFCLGRDLLLSDKPHRVRYVTNEGAWVPKDRSGANSVNLPPRVWTTMHLWGSLSSKQADVIRGRGKTTAHFVAQLPSGKRMRWRMDDCEPKA